MNNNKMAYLFFSSFLLVAMFAPLKGSAEEGTGKFLFSGRVGKGFEVFIVNDDGTGEKQITTTGGKAIKPKWSPDGKCFAYLNGDDLDLADINGHLIKQIKPTTGVVQDFDWSPDGQKIVFVCYLMPISTKICIEYLPKDHFHCISDRKIWCGNLTWSPDGEKIAFVQSSDEKGDQIVVLDADTGKDLLITDFKDDVKVPSPNGDNTYLDANLFNVHWVRDSQEIYFESFGGAIQNYILNVSSGKLKKWGEKGDEDLCLPREGKIAVFCGGKYPEVFSAEINGSKRKQLTPYGYYSGRPMFINHETKIAYLSNRVENKKQDAKLGIFVMNLDGSSPKRIANQVIDDNLSDGYSWHLFTKDLPIIK